MKRFALILLSILIVGLPASARACSEKEAFVYKSDLKCPADVQSYMDRINGCGHFSGEEPYDKERADFINLQMKNLRCDALQCDYADLAKKYAGQRKIKHVMTDYTKQVYGDIGACNPKQTSSGTYSSKEDCEKKTGRVCDYAMCDNAVNGKTFEESCGKDFATGWHPLSKPLQAESSIKTYPSKDDWHPLSKPLNSNPAVKSYSSKGDCEKKTGKVCNLMACDYVPGAKTYEEACGQNSQPGSGWRPLSK